MTIIIARGVVVRQADDYPQRIVDVKFAVDCMRGQTPALIVWSLGGDQASAGFHCPLTIPNGQAPPGERQSPSDIGNGRLWTLLPTDGKLAITTKVPSPPGTTFGELHHDGSLATRFPWWGGPSAGRRLRISGRRLDQHARPLRARIAAGFTAAPHFWATSITFASEGCWQVTGTAGTAKLAFVLEVMKH